MKSKVFTILSAVAILIVCGAVWLRSTLQAEPGSQGVFTQRSPASSSTTSVTPSSRPTPAPLQVVPASAGASTATHSIDGAGVVPSEIVAGSQQPVVFTAFISDPAVITSSVNLIQINANGSSTIVGALQPVGSGTFTLATSMPNLAAGTLGLSVSAAFYGALKRVQTPEFSFNVAAAMDTSDWTSVSPGGYLSIKLPPQFQIVDDSSSGGYDTHTFDVELSDGTMLATLYVYTAQQWAAVQQLITDATIPILLSQGNAFVVAYSSSENNSNSSGLNEGTVLNDVTQSLATVRAQ